MFSIHWVSDVRQTEIHTAEPLLPELSAFVFEVAIEKLKKDTCSSYGGEEGCVQDFGGET